MANYRFADAHRGLTTGHGGMSKVWTGMGFFVGHGFPGLSFACREPVELVKAACPGWTFNSTAHR